MFAFLRNFFKFFGSAFNSAFAQLFPRAFRTEFAQASGANNFPANKRFFPRSRFFFVLGTVFVVVTAFAAIYFIKSSSFLRDVSNSVAPSPTYQQWTSENEIELGTRWAGWECDAGWTAPDWKAVPNSWAHDWSEPIASTWSWTTPTWSWTEAMSNWNPSTPVTWDAPSSSLWIA